MRGRAVAAVEAARYALRWSLMPGAVETKRRATNCLIVRGRKG